MKGLLKLRRNAVRPVSGYLGGNDFSGNDHQRGEWRREWVGPEQVWGEACRRRDLTVTSQRVPCRHRLALVSASAQQSVSVSGTVRIPPYKVGTTSRRPDALPRPRLCSWTWPAWQTTVNNRTADWLLSQEETLLSLTRTNCWVWLLLDFRKHNKFPYLLILI